MADDDFWDMLAEAARLARDGARRGLRPSEIIDELVPFFESRHRIVSAPLLVALGREAFDLTIAECKGAPGWGWGRISDADEIDRYFAPLIERNRPRWDVTPDRR